MTTEEKNTIIDMDNRLLDLKERIVKLQKRKKDFLKVIQEREDKQHELPL